MYHGERGQPPTPRNTRRAAAAAEQRDTERAVKILDEHRQRTIDRLRGSLGKSPTDLTWAFPAVGGSLRTRCDRAARARPRRWRGRTWRSAGRRSSGHFELGEVAGVQDRRAAGGQAVVGRDVCSCGMQLSRRPAMSRVGVAASRCRSVAVSAPDQCTVFAQCAPETRSRAAGRVSESAPAAPSISAVVAHPGARRPCPASRCSQRGALCTVWARNAAEGSRSRSAGARSRPSPAAADQPERGGGREL